jgi:hypothetical protein
MTKTIPLLALVALALSACAAEPGYGGGYYGYGAPVDYGVVGFGYRGFGYGGWHHGFYRGG